MGVWVYYRRTEECKTTKTSGFHIEEGFRQTSICKQEADWNVGRSTRRWQDASPFRVSVHTLVEYSSEPGEL